MGRARDRRGAAVRGEIGESGGSSDLCPFVGLGRAEGRVSGVRSASLDVHASPDVADARIELEEARGMILLASGGTQRPLLVMMSLISFRILRDSCMTCQRSVSHVSRRAVSSRRSLRCRNSVRRRSMRTMSARVMETRWVEGGVSGSSVAAGQRYQHASFCGSPSTHRAWSLSYGQGHRRQTKVLPPPVHPVPSATRAAGRVPVTTTGRRRLRSCRKYPPHRGPHLMPFRDWDARRDRWEVATRGSTKDDEPPTTRDAATLTLSLPSNHRLFSRKARISSASCGERSCSSSSLSAARSIGGM
jgi:hypothetical protein